MYELLDFQHNIDQQVLGANYLAFDDVTKEPQRGRSSTLLRAVRTIVALAIAMAAFGGLYLAFSSRAGSSQTGAIAPTSVVLSASAPGMASTSSATLTIPSGTTVTLTIIPNHPLVPFQTFTMGIYAQDPYGFSELQYCTYPHTDTCSYVISYSSAERTDYTLGTHTFTAFLGNIGGDILQDSNNITITWS
jgi:hypothetical protein